MTFINHQHTIGDNHMTHTFSDAAVRCWIAIFLITVTLTGSSCSSNDSGTNTNTNSTTPATYQATFTLNGAGFNNRTFTVSHVASVYEDGVTAMSFSSMIEGKAFGVGLGIEGNSTGTQTISPNSPNSSVGIGLTWGADVSIGVTTGSMTITEYAAGANATIRGTFSGSATGIVNGTMATVEVKNGTFTAKRTN